MARFRILTTKPTTVSPRRLLGGLARAPHARPSRQETAYER